MKLAAYVCAIALVAGLAGFGVRARPQVPQPVESSHPVSVNPRLDVIPTAGAESVGGTLTDNLEAVGEGPGERQ
jgi:hypothetical protein